MRPVHHFVRTTTYDERRITWHVQKSANALAVRLLNAFHQSEMRNIDLSIFVVILDFKKIDHISEVFGAKLPEKSFSRTYAILGPIGN